MHDPTYVEGLRVERGYYEFRGETDLVAQVDAELARLGEEKSDDRPAKRGPGRPSRADRDATAGERN
jgi:hypothetical protein